MKNIKEIVFIGRSEFLYSLIERVLTGNLYKVKAIITYKASKEYLKNENDYKELALKFNIPFFYTNNINKPEILELIKGSSIAVSFNWINIIDDNFINQFRYGVLNVHMSDLIAYRGNAVLNWAIINKEKYLYYSIYLMEGNKLDCGKVLFQRRISIKNERYIEDIYNELRFLIPKDMLKVLDDIDKNGIKIKEIIKENEKGTFRCYPRLPEYSLINWDSKVEDIYNLIRASMYPYEAYTYQKVENYYKKLYIKKARIVCKKTKDIAFSGHILKNDPISGESWVKCKDGILAIQLCRYEGENEYFEPGKRWKSIRKYLGIIDIADFLRYT
jgi:methionyl-tRNA formyltransferase